MKTAITIKRRSTQNLLLSVCCMLISLMGYGQVSSSIDSTAIKIGAIKVGESLQVMARIRYRQVLEKATLYATTEGLYVAFETSQSAITEGQFVAWYLDDELVGSGVIS